MLHLRKPLDIRVPDRLAIVAAVALTVTAGAGVLGDAWHDESALTATQEDSEALPVRAEQADPTSDDARRKSGLTLRLLLFRQG